MSITRTGLHTSAEGKVILKQRVGLTAGTLKYKTDGDVQLNSPGDWTRILANANLFLANPNDTKEKYYLQPFTGCIPRDYSTNLDPKTHGVRLRDAAFVDYVSDTTVYTSAVKTQLLAFAVDPLFDFSNRSRFCTTNGGLGDANPGFPISEWMLRLLFAYDYIKGSFTSPERVTLDGWFLKAATYFNIILNAYYAPRFVDRINGNYTLTQYSIGAEADTVKNPRHTLYYGGPSAGFFADGYNNRMGTIAQFIGIAGIFLKNSELKTSAKRWFFENMKYGVYEGNDVLDFNRWSNTESEKGLNYVMGVVSVLSMLAFHFAFDGDTSLLYFSTKEGALGTQSSPNKSLLGIIQNTQKYLNGVITRYATSTDPSPLSAPDKLKIQIDGYEPTLPNRNLIISDTWVAMANVLFNDATVKTNYLRTASGTRPYPSSTAVRLNGANQPYGMNAHVLPSALLQFGQMEGVIDWLGTAPTPKTKQTITFPAIPVKTFGDSPFVISATAGSGLAVTFTVVSGPATIATNTVTLTGY